MTLDQIKLEDINQEIKTGSQTHKLRRIVKSQHKINQTHKRI